MNTEDTSDSRDNADLRQVLRSASVPDPIGGPEAARERVMSRVRHQFPPETVPAQRSSPFRRSFIGGALLAGLSLVVFLMWPEREAEADPLPSEAQMQQFYDQHETHHVAHQQQSEAQR
ncbi:hypothetical protein [Armatimonas rosea]|uniref:Uncharacterized protein n=1 Tax=Armatimonas rosea TaxID=685828 RepID=A0A7W9SRF4_ARMRO|nr:hypothetical protein [Armatimonas rosea]MBB6051447.1 hypothetical protein [Armatimonas rosea]